MLTPKFMYLMVKYKKKASNQQEEILVEILVQDKAKSSEFEITFVRAGFDNKSHVMASQFSIPEDDTHLWEMLDEIESKSKDPKDKMGILTSSSKKANLPIALVVWM